MSRSYELAQHAVALDRRYPNAHFALGLVGMWTRRSDRAIAAFKEAINLNPSFAAAHVLLGQMYLYGGEPQEAILLAEKGIRLSPSDPRLFIWLPALAGAHYQLRRYEEAIEVGRRSWTLNRNWPGGLRYVVAGLAQLGRMQEAQAALAELRRLNAESGLCRRQFETAIQRPRRGRSHPRWPAQGRLRIANTGGGREVTTALWPRGSPCRDYLQYSLEHRQNSACLIVRAARACRNNLQLGSRPRGLLA